MTPTPGKQNWQFFCEGPVRFAPIAWQGRVYFVSDDGYLYCLDAKEGTLLWKYSLAPTESQGAGQRPHHLRLARPRRTRSVRGQDLLCRQHLAVHGRVHRRHRRHDRPVVWENSGTGATYIPQPHNSPAFAGVAPQGYMAAGADKLLVTSRTVPACFDAGTGELLYYRLSENSYGKTVGGCSASIWKDWYFNGKVVYRLSDGLGLGAISGHVMTDDAAVGIDATGDVLAYRLGETETQDAKDQEDQDHRRRQGAVENEAEPAFDRIHLAAGNRLYGSNGQGEIAALQIPESKPNHDPRSVWRSRRCRDTVWNMLAGDGKLFVVTEEGQLYCFGAARADPRHYQNEAVTLSPGLAQARRRIQQVLQQAPEAQGYCLWFGTRNGGLLRELLRQSSLHVIVVEPNAAKVATLRQELDRAGLYGTRVCVLPGDIHSVAVPPYTASLIVVEDLAAAGT